MKVYNNEKGIEKEVPDVYAKQYIAAGWSTVKIAKEEPKNVNFTVDNLTYQQPTYTTDGVRR